jgi:hypothetical protein
MEDFYFVDRFHGPMLYSDWGATCHKVHTNFADESACLTADKVRNEVVSIYRSQERLKVLSFLS